MPARSTDGTLLDELVVIASRSCRAAEAPRSGPGARPLTPDWVLAVMVTIAVSLRKKSKNAQYLWWTAHHVDFCRWFPQSRFPRRSTFYDRYRRAHRLLQLAVEHQGREAVAKGWAQAAVVAIDKSLVAGRGRLWSPGDRRRKRLRKRVDPDTTWGVSKHDGWVQGYSFEVIVTADKQGAIWPLLASCDTASCSEHRSSLEKFQRLPETTVTVLADAGYDGNALAELVEQTHNGGPPQRRFLCPEVPRPRTGRPRQPDSRQSRTRQDHRQRREARRQYFQSPPGQQLYARRKVTVEPFHSQLKRLFELHDRVWHWGLDNNRTMILAAIFSYQILLTYNHRRRRKHARIKAILDAI